MARFHVGRFFTAAERQVSGAFRERLFYKGAALFLALVLWLVVSVEQPTSDRVPVRLNLQADSGVVIAGEPPVLTAQVVGRGREVQLLKILATEAEVLVSVSDTATDSIRVNLRPTDVLLPPSFDEHVDVRTVEPNVFTLRFTTRVRKRVPVRPRLSVTVDSALRTIGPAQYLPDSVTVIGTRQQVARVTEVPTIAGSVRVRDTVGAIIPLDTSGLGGASVVPSQIRLRVPVVRDTLLPLPFLMPWGRNP